ncbi:MAG: MBL fold metallo-hydrolase [Verrucomicrobiales bacterium]|jgi:Cft2 family RNA processing exonuclease|nr:MBL fold metallo-hydrolase [Verrucomicrobiales bacterium]
MPSFTNLTRGNEIGANSYLLELDRQRVILDAGMHPKLTGSAATPALPRSAARRADAIFLTHAHLDHAGCLPLAQLAQPDAPVFMSPPTRHLAEPLLFNSVNVMQRQREELNISEYPLFTRHDVHEAMKKWRVCPLNRWHNLGGEPIEPKELARRHGDAELSLIKKTPRLRANQAIFRFHHAGHILGSVMIELQAADRRILYTGDLCLHDQTLMMSAAVPPGPFDLLVVETTRGAQPSERGVTRGLVEQELLAAIRTVFARGGAVLIPIFALGKTQEILAMLHRARRRGDLPADTVPHIGGLGKVFTQAYDATADFSARAHRELDLLRDIRPQIFDLRKIARFKPRRGHLYLLPSGMMTENTTSNIIASHFLAHAEDAIFFVGYSDPDSPAGRLRRALADGDGRVTLNPRHGEQPIRSEVRYFDFTSHADREDLLNFIVSLAPKNIALVHGDTAALAWFRQAIPQHLPAANIFIPESGQRIEF